MELRKNATKQPVTWLPGVVVGNKCDSSERKVRAEQAEELARSLDVKYMESSGLQRINVETVFCEAFRAWYLSQLALTVDPKRRKESDKCCTM